MHSMDDQTACPKCRTALAIKDWTCPRCGAIIDRSLFGTVTLKPLAGEGRSAYLSGYQDCKRRKHETGSAAIQPESYHPTPRQETQYRAGWQRAEYSDIQGFQPGYWSNFLRRVCRFSTSWPLRRSEP